MSLSTLHRSDPDHPRRTPERASGFYALGNQVIPDYWTVRTTVMLDVSRQRASRVSERGEDAVSNHIGLDPRIPEFHLVQPGRIDGWVVQAHGGMRRQKRGGLLQSLMGGGIVDDDVDRTPARLRVDDRL